MGGNAMACDLHSLSIDLRYNSSSCSQNDCLANVLNDLLANVADRLDALDREIIKGEHDERDPVVMARRVRVRQPRALKYRNKVATEMPRDFSKPSSDSEGEQLRWIKTAESSPNVEDD